MTDRETYTSDVDAPEVQLYPEREKVGSLDRVAFLASGSGSTFEAMATAAQEGEIPAQYMVVITNKPEAGVLDRAERLGIESVVVDSDAMIPPAHDRQLMMALCERQIGLVFLAGYLKKIGPETLAVYEGRIINTHPALLPDNPNERLFGGEGMWGHHVHQAVYDSGHLLSGATVHLVDGKFDHGPVLRRAEVDVRGAEDPDEIATRVQTVEKPLCVGVLRDIINGEITLPR